MLEATVSEAEPLVHVAVGLTVTTPEFTIGTLIVKGACVSYCWIESVWLGEVVSARCPATVGDRGPVSGGIRRDENSAVLQGIRAAQAEARGRSIETERGRSPAGK